MADILVFRILTTTACNASCSYCYERGTQLVVMNDDTAEQTAAFICEQVKAAGFEVKYPDPDADPPVEQSPDANAIYKKLMS